MSLWSDPDLDYSGFQSLALQNWIRVYKQADPSMEYQMVIPSHLFNSIYIKQPTHLDSDLGQLIKNSLQILIIIFHPEGGVVQTSDPECNYNLPRNCIVLKNIKYHWSPPSMKEVKVQG